MNFFDNLTNGGGFNVAAPSFATPQNQPNPTIGPLAGGTNPGTPGVGGMQLASFLGMMASAMGGPNSGAGRVGAGVQQAANGSMMAAALLKREEAQRAFLQKLMAENNKIGADTSAALMGSTPEQVGGGISGFMGGK